MRGNKKPWIAGKSKKDYPQLSNSGRKKGYLSTRKGKTMEEIWGKDKAFEIKIKMSLAKTKKKVFDGFSKSLNRQFRNSVYWKLWREKVFIRDDFTCQKCGVRGCYLEPHHLIPLKECIANNNIDLIFDINNGLSVCRECHLAIHGWKTKINKGE